MREVVVEARVVVDEVRAEEAVCEDDPMLLVIIVLMVVVDELGAAAGWKYTMLELDCAGPLI